jgi:hypothetical protein
MKRILLKSLASAVAAFALTTANVALAQAVEEKTTTVTTSSGTISDFGGDRLIIRSETAPAPITYSYSKTTTYVDEAGNPVSIETVKSGLPVTVHYVKDGDRLVASKVIVRKTVKTEVK